MKEEWRGLIYQGKDYSKWIEVSDLGRVKNPKTNKIRKQNLLKTGYYFVTFSMGSRDKKKTFRVHKGLAETFIPNLENKASVNHIDGDKTNNNLSNLEWATQQENAVHAYEMGLTNPRSGLNHPFSTLTQEDVKEILKTYKPYDSKYGARALGRKFNVSHPVILRTVKRKK